LKVWRRSACDVVWSVRKPGGNSGRSRSIFDGPAPLFSFLSHAGSPFPVVLGIVLVGLLVLGGATGISFCESFSLLAFWPVLSYTGVTLNLSNTAKVRFYVV